MIIDQVHHNLFHGSKLESVGPEGERNRILVRNSDQITRAILDVFAALHTANQ